MILKKKSDSLKIFSRQNLQLKRFFQYFIKRQIKIPFFRTK